MKVKRGKDKYFDTFAINGKKPIFCPCCKRHLRDSYLIDDKSHEKTCDRCGVSLIIAKPVKLDKDGKHVIQFGIAGESGHGGMFTADETDEIQD